MDIVSVVSGTVALRKSGRNHTGLCPFHKERTPSFSVNREKNLFKCFGCGEAGDALTFLMKVRGKTFVEVDNLATCDSYMLANTRAGVEKDGFRLELFVKNLFNDNNWAACSRFSEFDLPLDLSNLTQYQGVIVAPQNKRQFGLKTAIKF